MIAFEVLVNGEQKCLASVGEYGSLSAALNWHNSYYSRTKEEEGKRSPLNLYIGGSIEPESVQWPDLKIKVGDEVTLRVLEISTQNEVSEPTYNRHRKTPSEVEVQARLYLDAAYAMLPTPPIETPIIAVAEYERFMAQNSLILSVGKLINLGQVNTVINPFWKSVAAAAHLLGQERDRDYCIQRTKRDETCKMVCSNHLVAL